MRILTSAIAAATLTGCMSIPAFLPDANQVRYITADQAKRCAFVQTVVFDNTYITTHGKSPDRFERTGDVGIRNATAAAGGNAVLLTSKESNWFVGTFNYQGGAYRCPT